MYKITKRETAEIIAFCDKIRYVIQNNGVFFQAVGAHDAHGIAVGGKVYNFGETEKIVGAPFVDICTVDNGEYLFNVKNTTDTALTETNAVIDELIVSMLEG